MDSVIVGKQDFHAVFSTKSFLGLVDRRVYRPRLTYTKIELCLSKADWQLGSKI